MKHIKCNTCGKKCTTGIKIEPEDIVPEVEKTLYFCSRRCANVYIGTVKRERKKNLNKNIRAQLESADYEPTDKELDLILATLTNREKTFLSAIGVGVLLASYRTCKEFFEHLKNKLK